jgi:hypothetical protein
MTLSQTSKSQGVPTPVTNAVKAIRRLLYGDAGMEGEGLGIAAEPHCDLTPALADAVLTRPTRIDYVIAGLAFSVPNASNSVSIAPSILVAMTAARTLVLFRLRRFI